MLTGDLAVMKDLVYALILIVIVIYKNAPGLKGFREKYNLQTLSAKLFKRSGADKAEESGQEAAQTPDAKEEN